MSYDENQTNRNQFIRETMTNAMVNPKYQQDPVDRTNRVAPNSHAHQV